MSTCAFAQLAPPWPLRLVDVLMPPPSLSERKAEDAVPARLEI
jgi:hypothetical protein